MGKLMHADLNPDLLRTFVAIADTGSFTRAAGKVHRTQSAVSMQVKRLEQTVRQPLFERDGRSVRLTGAGESLIGYARRMLRLQDEALSALMEPDMEGSVCIGTPEEYATRFMPGILSGFAQAHPRVQVELRCRPSSVLVSEVDAGEIDLGLITYCCDSGRNGTEVVWREPAVWATSAQHMAHEENPVRLALFEPGCLWRRWALDAMDAAGRDYRIGYSSPSFAGLQAAVLAGQAVTVLCRGNLTEGLRELTPEEGFPPLPMVEIGLERAPGLASMAAESLGRHIVQAFRDQTALARF